MRMKSFVACLLFFATILLSSCLTDEEKGILHDWKQLDTLSTDQDKDIDTIQFNTGGTNYGQSVPLAEAEPCFRAYDTLMPKHGIMNHPPPASIALGSVTPIQITTRECFRGRELNKFLRNAAKLHCALLHIPHPVNTSIRVALGVCTPEYAAARKDPRRAGRICVFIASGKFEPGTKGKTAEWKPINLTDYKKFLDPKLFDPGDDNTVFDFGGLEP